MQQSRAEAVAAMNEAFVEVEGEADKIISKFKVRSAENGREEARADVYIKFQALSSSTLAALAAVLLARLDKEGA